MKHSDLRFANADCRPSDPPKNPPEVKVLERVADPLLIKPGMYLGHLSMRELALLRQECLEEERSR